MSAPTVAPTVFVEDELDEFALKGKRSHADYYALLDKEKLDDETKKTFAKKNGSVDPPLKAALKPTQSPLVQWSQTMGGRK